MKSHNIKFMNFWIGFNPHCNIFLDTFRDICNQRKELQKSDILIYSLGSAFGGQVDGNPNFAEYEHYKKICYSPENLNRFGIDPHEILDKGHYLISMERIDHPNYLRLPNIVRAGFYGYDPTSIDNFSNLPNKTKFCSWIAGNCKSEYRNNFVKKLSEYKKVDCPGRCMNNMTDEELSKTKHIGNVEFLSNYKFNVAFENSSVPGYCTEKIWWGFLSKTISLYWGDPTVYQDFNEGSFLSRHDFDSDGEFIDAIVKLDNDDDAYYEMLVKPKLRNHSLLDLNRIKEFFEKVMGK
jgi:hypothetical protein